MKLVRLTLTGFLSFRFTTTVEFGDLTLCAITGPNGAGKSSILHGVSWALYGDVRVAGDRDSIINDYEEYAEVVLELEDSSGTTWRVTRTKAWQAGSSLGLQHLDPQEGVWITYGDHRIATTQEQIYRIVGLDEAGFYSLVVMDQASTAGGTRFTRATSRERRDILMGLIPELQVWYSIAAAANVKVAEMKADRDKVAQRLEHLDGEATAATEELQGLTSRLAELSSRDQIQVSLDDLDRRAVALRELVNSELSGRTDLSAQLDTLTARRELRNAEVRSRRADLDRELAQVTRANQELDRAIRRRDEIRDTRGASRRSLRDAEVERGNLLRDEEPLRSDIDQLVKTREAAVVDLSTARSRMDELGTRIDVLDTQHDHGGAGVCMVCSSPITEQKVTELLSAARARHGEEAQEVQRLEELLASFDVDLRRNNRVLGDLQRRVTELNGVISSTESQITEQGTRLTELVSLVEERQADLEEMASPDDIHHQLDGLVEEPAGVEEMAIRDRIAGLERGHPASQELAEVGERVAALRRQADLVTRLEGSVDSVTGRVSAIQDQVTSQQAALARNQGELDTAIWVAQACSQRGIPSRLLTDVLADIERRQNEILYRLLGDQAMQVEFRQTRELKSREGTKEVLDIVVRTAEGFERTIEAFSFGERVRITLSNLFALVQVFNDRHGRFVDTLFLDEPLGPLDENSIPALLGVLRDALDQGIVKNIMVVTHDPRVVDALPQRMVVQRSTDAEFTTTVEMV